MTVNDLKKVLNQWPDGTVIYINLANAIDDPAGEYEWHDFTICKPSESEIKHFTMVNESSYVCIDVLPEILGC